MLKITRDSTPEQVEAYWKEVMQYRMEQSIEVHRLLTAGLGFYCRHKDHEKIYGKGYIEHYNFLDFIENNKRPWGNKGKESSIIFNIGWDAQWVMRYHEIPDWVEDEARKLYQLVIEEIKLKMNKDEFEKDSVWRL